MRNCVRTGRVTIAIGLILVLVAAAIVTFLPLVKVEAEPMDTHHSSWHLIRSLAAEDAADFATALALATSAGDYANKLSDAFHIRTFGAAGGGREGYSAGGAWMFVFCGTDAADDVFSFNLVGWAKRNGMAQVICEGNGILGTQDVVIYPGGTTATNGYWADTIVLDETTKWPSVAVYNSGDNEVAFILVDMTGIDWVYPIIYDAAGTAEATAIAVYGRRY